MPDHAARQEFSRAEIRRKAGVTERQLKNWEKQRLISLAESYTFSDLLALRTLKALKRSRVPDSAIREAVAAVTTRSTVNPLSEVRMYAAGRKIRVRLSGHEMDPLSGQFFLDFDPRELNRLLALPRAPLEPSPRMIHEQKVEADRWFQRGLDLEQEGAPIADVVQAYQRAVELDPHSAGALVNLGTIYFHARAWHDAETYYRRALEVDPEYALAHFNLGNLYDEKGDQARAFFHYQSALRIHPNYADAHYNLALLYQAANQVMKAVSHWKAYLRLDPGSTWAGIARRELQKLRRATVVEGSKPITLAATTAPGEG